MYKLDLPVDYKEAAAIERRKNMEEQRKSRIFNAKTRLIGVDMQALDQQIQEKKQIQETENRRDRAYAAAAIRNDKIGELLDARQQHDQKELDRALTEFRALHQQPSSRREFDLYDPEYLKKDSPARVSDDDPRCGISSMQKFDGEDLNNKARLKFQSEQQREWAEQQLKEKNAAEAAKNRADRLYELKMKELDQRAMELADAEEECRRAIKSATADYNKAQAREREAREALMRQQEEDDKMTEMANHVFGDFLTENPAVAQSAFGSHRVITDRWKGMSPEQIAEIKRIQEMQMKEAQQKKEEEARHEEEWERQMSKHARAGMVLEREKQRREREMQKQLAQENLYLGQEQKARNEYLEKEVYTNKPNAAYFMQWNTTTR